MAQQLQDRQQLKRKLQARCQRIRAMVYLVVSRLEQPRGGRQYIEDLAAAMDAGEQEIMALKEQQQQQFEELLAEVSWQQCLTAEPPRRTWQ